MPWVEATLRDQRVLARCDSGGELLLDGGRVDVVYKVGASKVYRAGASNIVIAPNAKVYADEQVSGGNANSGGESQPAKATRTTKAAKTAAAEPPQAAKTEWTAYTDGACSGNPGPAGAGFILFGPNKEIIEGYEYLGSQTNNVGELVGIERALDLFPKDATEVTIYTDSQYAIGVLSKGWKAKANVDLIARIRDKVKARKKVHFIYVRGHVGHEFNEKADELARLAVSSRKSAVR